MKCPYADRCWRYSYTRYLKDIGWEALDQPPTQFDVSLQGYADPSMMNKRKDGKYCRDSSIFAINMPNPMSERNNCPETKGHHFTDCEEYNKEEKRLAKKKQSAKFFEDSRKKQAKEQGVTYRPYIPREIKEQVAQRDKYKCVYCLRGYQYLKRNSIQTHIDHFISLENGGTCDIDNLVYSCKDCNLAKGSQVWQKGCRIGYYC